MVTVSVTAAQLLSSDIMLSTYIKRAKSGKTIVFHLLSLIACSSCEVISAVISGEDDFDMVINTLFRRAI